MNGGRCFVGGSRDGIRCGLHCDWTWNCMYNRTIEIGSASCGREYYVVVIIITMTLWIILTLDMIQCVFIEAHKHLGTGRDGKTISVETETRYHVAAVQVTRVKMIFVDYVRKHAHTVHTTHNVYYRWTVWSSKSPNDSFGSILNWIIRFEQLYWVKKKKFKFKKQLIFLYP
jgi:hypothetical protein